MTTLDIVAQIEGGLVMAYWIWNAKHTGPRIGLPSSGKQIQMSGVDIFWLKDGKLVEGWHVEKLMTLFEDNIQKEGFGFL